MPYLGSQVIVPRGSCEAIIGGSCPTLDMRVQSSSLYHSRGRYGLTEVTQSRRQDHDDGEGQGAVGSIGS